MMGIPEKAHAPIAVVVLAILVGAGMFWADHRENTAHRQSVIDLMKDPTGVMFRNESADKTGVIHCGEVNGKNSYGAYAGWEWFSAVRTSSSRGWFVTMTADGSHCDE